MADYPHAEIISTLRELYMLLDTLAAIPANLLHLPPHPPNAINTAAALAAGYDADTVSLMCALPYLDIAQHEMFLQLLPSTFPITYLGDMDEGDFEARREMLHDEVMPPAVLRLTRSEIYGTEFIYDTKTNLMTPWKPIDNPDEVDDYFHVPAAPPREILGPVIENYRSLNYLGTPEGINFNDDLFSESGGQPPKDWGPDDCRRWRTQYDVWAATRMLKDIYLECGWDVNAVEQTNFRRDEFLEKRARYWEDVVEPLIKIDEETK